MVLIFFKLKKHIFLAINRVKSIFYSIALFVFLISTTGKVIGQTYKDLNNSSKENPLYIETEVMLGKLLPVYPNYPSSSLQKTFFFNIGNYLPKHLTSILIQEMNL